MNFVGVRFRIRAVVTCRNEQKPIHSPGKDRNPNVCVFVCV